MKSLNDWLECAENVLDELDKKTCNLKKVSNANSAILNAARLLQLKLQYHSLRGETPPDNKLWKLDGDE